MTLGERIRKIRKDKDLTQQEFADRIGSKRNTVATYEMGRTDPSTAVISLICREFNVSETWLRTGEGEMFVELPRNEALAAQIQSFLQGGTDSFRERLVSLLLRLKPEQWDMLENYLMAMMDLVQPSPTGQERTQADTAGQERAVPDLAAKVAELERQNQALAAKVAAMEEEDAIEAERLRSASAGSFSQPENAKNKPGKA